MKKIVFASVFGIAVAVSGAVTKIQMPSSCTTPDGMAIDAAGRLVIAAPNNDRRAPGAIFRMDTPDGAPYKWFEVPVNPETGFAAPMGVCFGPEGELYICDCQPDRKGRLLRATFKDDRLAACETVACGLENANGVKYLNGRLYLTQAYQRKIERTDGHSQSALYMFAATDRNVRVTNTPADTQSVFTDFTTNRVKRGGLNGVAVTKSGIVYTGNYGDGRIWKLTPGADGRIAKTELFAVGLPSADGLCVDGAGNLYVADMLGCSAVRFAPDGTRTVLAKDCFTRPSEPCFWQGRLYVADFGATTLSVVTPGAAPEWPVVTRDMRPWCYNWWMGSAVDAKGLEAQADALAKAGFGGFHAIPIYGAKGWEAKYREFLSPDWMSAFADAVRIGNSRDLGVDLTMGSGWCFGGPQLKPEEGCWRLFVTANEKDVKKGMQVLWKGTDNDGKPRLLVTALTGQKVKRAGLGGQGPMMDPYSVTAMDHFLAPYTAAFDRPGAVKPEHLYHDSFEYFGAGWSPDFFAAFKAKRGYDLRDHLAELAGVGTDEAVARIKCDYRETLSDLIIEDVFPRWFDWCRARGIATRNEGHGAPANWLDFYALADVPETEMFGEECRDVLVSKFASSVAHLTEKPMVSSESCTWLGQHFTETLADAKIFLDRLFLAGVNHMFYHGCCYSAVEAPWPGWCFYASSQMNPRNPIWRDTDALSAYITRCQSVFRAYAPDNDVLVYWPLRDYWMDKEGFMKAMSVHNAQTWFNSQPIGKTAQALYDAGYAFDYVSDRMLQNGLKTLGKYAAIVVPPCKYMPEKTKASLDKLAAAGMKIYWNGETPTVARREPFAAEAGLMYARYRKGASTVYFIVNTGDARVRRAFRPAAATASAWTMDPMTGRIAALPVKDGELALDLFAKHSTILLVSSQPAQETTAKTCGAGAGFAVTGTWTLTPVAGGPDPWPAPREMAQLTGWERNADGSENAFCGTMRYRTTFDAPRTDMTVLDLGDVRQSAHVWLNGRDLGKTFLAPFSVAVPPGTLKEKGNVLEIEVTSVAANRIRKMDKDGTPWRVFHDINFASYKGGKFDASKWPLTVNGLLGPVTFRPEGN